MDAVSFGPAFRRTVRQARNREPDLRKGAIWSPPSGTPRSRRTASPAVDSRPLVSRCRWRAVVRAKTTVVERIIEGMGDIPVSLLHHDSYYRDHPDLSLEQRALLNYDHPGCTRESIDGGAPARPSDGSFRTGARVRFHHSSEIVRHTNGGAGPGHHRGWDPGPWPIPSCADLMDIRVFVDTDPDVRFIRRLQRDTEDRGRTVASVIEQYEATGPAHASRVRGSQPPSGSRDHTVRGRESRRDRDARRQTPGPRRERNKVSLRGPVVFPAGLPETASQNVQFGRYACWLWRRCLPAATRPQKNR